jgi:hypothetical protein
VSESPAFRRAIVIRGAGGRVEADLEDDFHSFGVTLHHDGHTVRCVEARATRYPWATCLEAPVALAALEGAAIRANPATLFQHADPRAHCTHLFELAALAIAQAARGDGERLFEAEVTDPEGESCTARLFRDGELTLAWRLTGDVIDAPSPYAGEPLAGFSSKRLAGLEAEEAETLLILRRVVQTARGRQMDVDAFATAAAMGRPAQCYSLQPPNATRATRVTGSIRDWPNRPVLRSAVQRRPGC